MGCQPRRRIFLALWLLGIAGMAASVVWSLWPAPPPPPPLEGVLDGDVPGVREPPTRRANEAAVSDDAPVVGVTAGGRSRAYALGALEYGPDSHVVNDVLGGVPVSVTHCDIYKCTRVFSGDKPGEPLDLAVGGVKHGGLILKSGGHSYLQESAAPLTPDEPPFPYERHEAVVQPWGEWRRAHPDTDIYLGPHPPEPLTPEAAEAARNGSVPVVQNPKTVPPDRLTTFLVAALNVGAPPLLIAAATLLAHFALAYLLRRRQDRTGAVPPVAPGAPGGTSAAVGH